MTVTIPTTAIASVGTADTRRNDQYESRQSARIIALLPRMAVGGVTLDTHASRLNATVAMMGSRPSSASMNGMPKTEATANGPSTPPRNTHTMKMAAYRTYTGTLIDEITN